MKRPRARSFAPMQALPAWLRALAVALRALVARPSPSPFVEALRRVPASGRPKLRSDGAGDPGEGRGALARPVHRCTGCGLCAELCPTRSLSLASPHGSEATSRHGLRLELVRDRCTGCGLCVERCPEDALIAVRVGEARVARAVGGARVIDLMDERAGGGRR
ncbi:MAG: 4Fe-4S binding protein [Spirochaetaceae bacterium]|nr:4Fe-4S binding protein [Myxococcales bacterium]MCB9723700.1 4Fe-4S binding protein [Spirochaetaceae bacterium]